MEIGGAFGVECLKRPGVGVLGGDVHALYECGLAWACQQVQPLKVLDRPVKKLEGWLVLCGGMPATRFDAWLASRGLGV